MPSDAPKHGRRPRRTDQRGTRGMTATEYAAFKRAWLFRIAKDRSLPPLAASLAIILAERFFAHDRGGVAFMSQSTLAEIAGVKRPAVSQTMAKMERRGLLNDLATGGRTKTYIIGGVQPQERADSSDTYPADMFADANRSGVATCSPMQTVQEGEPEARPVRIGEQEPVRIGEHDPVRVGEHNLRKNELRESELRESSSLRSDDARSADVPPEPIASKPTAQTIIAEAAAPSRGNRKGSGKVSALNGSAEAVAPSLPFDSEGPASAKKSGRAKKQPNGAKIAEGEAKIAFAEFWQLVPKKVGKTSAEIAFVRIVTTGEATPTELCAGMIRYATTCDRRENGRFIKHPKGWLTDGRWKDETSPSRPNSMNNHGNFARQQPSFDAHALFGDVDADKAMGT